MTIEIMSRFINNIHAVKNIQQNFIKIHCYLICSVFNLYHTLLVNSADDKLVIFFLSVRGLDTLDRVSAISAKGDNYCDFRFALLHAKSRLKRGLL